jgi:hypothetical protein
MFEHLAPGRIHPTLHARVTSTAPRTVRRQLSRPVDVLDDDVDVSAGQDEQRDAT